MVGILWGVPPKSQRQAFEFDAPSTPAPRGRIFTHPTRTSSLAPSTAPPGLATSPGLRVVARDTAFRRVPNNAGFDISRDGSRLLISVLQSTAYPLAVVPGWRAELRERLAASR
jgi:hypothetical protein